MATEQQAKTPIEGHPPTRSASSPSGPSEASDSAERRASVRQGSDSEHGESAKRIGQALDFIFHPRSVAVAGASPPQPGFGGMGSGFVISLQEMGCPAIYPVNPHHEEIEGLKCYPSLLEIEGPVDHVISSVPARAVPSLIDDCIAKGVKSIHFFTAGFSETGEEELAEMEAQVVRRAVEAGIRDLGPKIGERRVGKECRSRWSPYH